MTKGEELRLARGPWYENLGRVESVERAGDVVCDDEALFHDHPD